MGVPRNVGRLYFALHEKILGRKVLLCIPVLVFLTGCGDELIQGVVPNKVYDFRDILMNFTGGILGELILVIFNPALIKVKERVSKT
ncbi:MAG: VanZ family protein [Deltaproteobacteria bacterium]|nr:VanZ family protein [Deltaproteobacteria bacterium]